jgi:hypothetical protein
MLRFIRTLWSVFDKIDDYMPFLGRTFATIAEFLFRFVPRN